MSSIPSGVKSITTGEKQNNTLRKNKKKNKPLPIQKSLRKIPDLTKGKGIDQWIPYPG